MLPTYSKKLLLLSCFILFNKINFLYAQQKIQLIVSGLTNKVEVLRDQWGVNHIYAQNENDLFFTAS